jgi:hypothetical protein
MDDLGCTAVTLAACGGLGQGIKYILDSGFPADVPDSNGHTAYWYAA